MLDAQITGSCLRMSIRNPVYDIMKGIGIILMLIGHIPPRESVFHFIYSFHMPLFFIVAGVFANTEKMDLDVIRKNALRLLLPVLVTMIAIIVLSPLHYFIDGNINYSIAQVLSLFWAGDALPTKFGFLTLDSMWFLVALFWVKCFFQGFAHFVRESFHRYGDEVVLGLCFVISVGAVVLHSIIPYVPWELLKGLSAVWFYAMGWYVKRHRLPLFIWIGFSLCWFLALRFGAMNMVFYSYKVYPLDVFGAVGAAWLVYILSKGIDQYTSRFSKLLQWFGVNSLLILCVNTLDRKSFLVRAIKGMLDIHLSGFSNTVFHYSIEFFLVVLLLSIPISKQLFKAKRWCEL